MVKFKHRKPLPVGLREHYDRLYQHGWVTLGEDFICDGKYCSKCPLNGTRCLAGALK